MSTTLSVHEAQAQLPELVARAVRDAETCYIEDNGQPVAVLVSLRSWQWSEDGLVIVGKTPVGRATAEALKLNRPSLVIVRQTWVQWGVHPPNR